MGLPAARAQTGVTRNMLLHHTGSLETEQEGVLRRAELDTQNRQELRKAKLETEQVGVEER